MLLKIYLKGFERPHAVVGEKLFEDERYLVIQTKEVPRRKIPVENILYYDEFEIEMLKPTQEPPLPLKASEHCQAKELMPVPEPQQLSPKNNKEKLQEFFNQEGVKEAVSKKMIEFRGRRSGTPTEFEAAVSRNLEEAPREEVENPDVIELEAANVTFKGHKIGHFTVDVPKELLKQDWHPTLASKIFQNDQIKAFMGDFVMHDSPVIEGNNIYIDTKSIKGGQTAAEAGKANLQMVGKSIKQTIESKFPTPKTAYPVDFTMGTGSEVADSAIDPFETLLDIKS